MRYGAGRRTASPQAPLAISDWVSSLPGAVGTVPAIPLLSAILLATAAVTLCLFRGPLRLVALPIFAAGLIVAPFGARPDILIERTGANVAARTDGGTLVPANSRRGRFAIEAWLRADGEPVSFREAARRSGWTCAADLCRADIKGKRVLYVHEGKTQPGFACEADVLIVDFPLRGRCPSVPLRIDRFDLWRLGAHGLYFDGSSVTIE